MKKKRFIPDTEALNDEDTRKLFKDHEVAALDDVDDGELVTELNNKLISALNSAAE